MLTLAFVGLLNLFHVRIIQYMYHTNLLLNTLRTGILNCLNARSRGLNFRHRASSI